MRAYPFTKGLHDLGNGLWGYLQPDGSWGWSNAGLIEDSGDTLLVDTLFDVKLTEEMLATMRKAVPAARSIETLVNTHGNGDHVFGNQLFEGKRIISTRGCIDDMKSRPATQLQEWNKNWQKMGIAGRFWWEVMGSKFDFSSVRMTLPNETFEGEKGLVVGTKHVVLVDVSPAHTRGDLLVYVPKDRTVFTGDMLFVGGHPAIWAGPVSNWIRACDRMLGWDVETVVPGHGPITDKAGVRRLRDYLVYLLAESKQCRDAGMSFVEAAESIAFDAFRDWGEAERIYVNVHACYRELGANEDRAAGEAARMELLELMGKRYFATQGKH